MSAPRFYPCHPEDAAEEWARATLVARTLLAVIAELQERHGDEWGEHLPGLLESPHATLLALAEDLEDAGRIVTYRVGLFHGTTETGRVSARSVSRG